MRQSLSLIQVAVLLLLPVLAGVSSYFLFFPTIKPPVEISIEQPVTPSTYRDLRNPLSHPSQDQVQKFIVGQRPNTISFEGGKKLLLNKYIDQGIFLYQKNCSPCHGVKADGDGIVARSLRLKPAELSGRKLESLPDAYLFWRVKEGYKGLDSRARPWDSSMPPWSGDLSDEQIWSVILALRAMNNPRLMNLDAK